MADDYSLDRPEKRTHRRIDVDIDVNLIVDGKKIDTTATNLSCGGIFVPVDYEVIPKQLEVELTINLPDHAKPVKVFGVISRAGKENPSSQKEGVAIRFNRLYDENILAIDRFIKSRMH